MIAKLWNWLVNDFRGMTADMWLEAGALWFMLLCSHLIGGLLLALYVGGRGVWWIFRR